MDMGRLCYLACWQKPDSSACGLYVFNLFNDLLYEMKLRRKKMHQTSWKTSAYSIARHSFCTSYCNFAIFFLKQASLILAARLIRTTVQIPLLNSIIFSYFV